ncbi:rhodanese-like domain-containing protein [Alteromonas sp. A081]|uniref:rhodanese-like domain-containing protein n=1 Tax=Alteromonas sp. A081 TaxID=3410269 RepID=UPI003B983BC2
MLIDLKSRLENIDVNIRIISAKEAADEMKTNQGLLVDVREPAEVAENHVEASLHIPRGILEMKMLELVNDASKPIYLHCASGARAKLSAEQLIRMGYENVSVITCSLATIKQVHRT